VVFVDRFRPPSAKRNKFFLWFKSGNAIVNPTKELDSVQHDFGLPFLCSSNARHVLETLKGNVPASTPPPAHASQSLHHSHQHVCAAWRSG